MNTATLTQNNEQTLLDIQNKANSAPVVLTDETGPSHVILSIADYKRLISGKLSIVDLLWMPGMVDVDFDPQRSSETARAADFS
jgi:hypothetical protein